MDPAQLIALAHECAVGLPIAELTHPFGPDWDVFKVRGRVFMLTTEVHGEPMLIVKADPEDGLALREQFTEVTPGYHMNKKHWNSVVAGPRLDEELVRELVIGSYLCVVEKLPQDKRPVDPETFLPQC